MPQRPGANRTISALAEGELVIEELTEAMCAVRQRVWAAGGAPLAVVSAEAAEQAGEDDRAQGSGCGGSVWTSTPRC